MTPSEVMEDELNKLEIIQPNITEEQKQEFRIEFRLKYEQQQKRKAKVQGPHFITEELLQLNKKPPYEYLKEERAPSISQHRSRGPKRNAQSISVRDYIGSNMANYNYTRGD